MSNQEHSPVPIERTGPDDRLVDLSIFAPILERFISVQGEKVHAEAQIQEKRLEFNKVQLSAMTSAAKHYFWLGFVVTILLFALAGGLAFALKEVTAGLMVISHVGAVAAGLLAGMGLSKSRMKG